MSDQDVTQAFSECLSNSLSFQLNAKDVSYFDSAFTEDDPLLTPLPREFLDSVNQDQFKGFSYTDPNYALPPI